MWLPTFTFFTLTCNKCWVGEEKWKRKKKKEGWEKDERKVRKGIRKTRYILKHVKIACVS